VEKSHFKIESLDQWFDVTFITLVDVEIAVRTDESLWAGAVVLAGDDVRLADGTAVARVASAGVVQVAEEAGLSGWALAVVVCDAVVASGAVEAGLGGAVIHVHLAVLALVAVDADALVTVVRVRARRTVLADV
jgi:hypothetical protein